MSPLLQNIFNIYLSHRVWICSLGTVRLLCWCLTIANPTVASLLVSAVVRSRRLKWSASRASCWCAWTTVVRFSVHPFKRLLLFPARLRLQTVESQCFFWLDCDCVMWFRSACNCMLNNKTLHDCSIEALRSDPIIACFGEICTSNFCFPPLRQLTDASVFDVLVVQEPLLAGTRRHARCHDPMTMPAMDTRDRHGGHTALIIVVVGDSITKSGRPSSMRHKFSLCDHCIAIPQHVLQTIPSSPLCFSHDLYWTTRPLSLWILLSFRAPLHVCFRFPRVSLAWSTFMSPSLGTGWRAEGGRIGEERRWERGSAAWIHCHECVVSEMVPLAGLPGRLHILHVLSPLWRSTASWRRIRFCWVFSKTSAKRTRHVVECCATDFLPLMSHEDLHS